MKGKYVYILWAEVTIIPVLLSLILSSLGLPMVITSIVIIIVLIGALSVTFLQIYKEEKVEKSGIFLEPEEKRELKRKERIIIILFICFVVIGFILIFVSNYYKIAAIVEGNVVTEGFSYLDVLSIVGSLLVGISFFLVILWAFIVDKEKKMKVH